MSPIERTAGGGGSSSGGAGTEISYDQITAFVNITSTNIAAPTLIIQGSAHVYDGAFVLVQFYSPAVSAPAVVGNQTEISLTMDGVDLGRGLFSAGTNTSFASNNGAANIWLRTTPSAASHTFAVTAFAQSTTGTPAVAAGTGG